MIMHDQRYSYIAMDEPDCDRSMHARTLYIYIIIILVIYLHILLININSRYIQSGRTASALI